MGIPVPRRLMISVKMFVARYFLVFDFVMIRGSAVIFVVICLIFFNGNLSLGLRYRRWVCSISFLI